MIKGKYYWLPPVLWGCLIIMLSLLPGGKTNLQLFGIPYADKVGHFGMYAIWSFLIYHAFIRPDKLTPAKAFWLTILLSSLIGILLEYGQNTVFIGRSYELADMVANALGAVAGTIAGYIVIKKKSGEPNF